VPTGSKIARAVRTLIPIVTYSATEIELVEAGIGRQGSQAQLRGRLSAVFPDGKIGPTDSSTDVNPPCRFIDLCQQAVRGCVKCIEDVFNSRGLAEIHRKRLTAVGDEQSGRLVEVLATTALCDSGPFSGGRWEDKTLPRVEFLVSGVKVGEKTAIGRRRRRY